MSRKRFSQFSPEFQLLADTLPMLVSVTRNPDEETEEQFVKTHDRFLELDELTKEKLADVKTAEKIQNIGKMNNLDLIQTSDIARAVRKYYFGELKKENFALEISKTSGISMDQASAITNAVMSQIVGDNSFEERLDKIALTPALKKYDKLGEQLLSGNPIKLKIFEAPVRPSIKNWIADYYEKLDATKHDSIERGNYLFHSENAMRLTSGERQRVGTVLRALDEDGLLSVDPQRQEVVFGAGVLLANSTPAQRSVQPGSAREVTGGMSFTSPHKFTSETGRPNPFAAMPRQNQRPSNNIVDLKND